MAQAPMPMAGAAPMAGADDTDMADASGAPDDEAGGEVVVTIADDGQGGYVVFAGDGDEGGDMGDAGAGGAPMAAPSGTPAASIGAALKVALDIMKEHESSAGGEGSSEDQFAAGFGAAPKGGGLKYPPAAA